MEDMLYERPREKLRHRGCEVLTVVELLQVIIGSGSPKVSSAQLARQLEKIAINNPVYDTLRRVHGMGDAKTCQVLAAIELGKRLSS